LLGWITVGAGSLNVLRLIAEVFQLYPQMGTLFYLLVELDLLLGFLGILSGLALNREEWSWGWWLGAAFWGAVLGSSLVIMIVVFPTLAYVVRNSPQREELLAIAPRLLFYVVALAASPYVARLIWLGPEEGGPSRRTIVGWGVFGFLAAGGFCVILLP
jgi:hypothetical protein